MVNGSTKTLIFHMDGQSMVEFALVLPLLVLIIAGIFDLGRAFYASITITNAAREGARTGALDSDNSPKICKAAHDEALSSKINLSYSKIEIVCGNNYSVSVFCNDPPESTASIVCPENQPIIVKVSYTYSDMLFSFFFPTGIDMRQKVEMLVP